MGRLFMDKKEMIWYAHVYLINPTVLSIYFVQSNLVILGEAYTQKGADSLFNVVSKIL